MEHCPCEDEELTPVYYVKCTNFWSEFKDTGSFPYCEVHVCDYKEETDCRSMEEAEALAKRKNAAGFVCPKCGKTGKLKGTCNFEIYQPVPAHPAGGKEQGLSGRDSDPSGCFSDESRQ